MLNKSENLPETAEKRINQLSVLLAFRSAASMSAYRNNVTAHSPRQMDAAVAAPRFGV